MLFGLINKKLSMKTEYPEALQIETTNRCNARCSFCYHQRMKRPLVDMPDSVFEKIIKDAREIKPKFVLPFLHGEMFLDKKIFLRMAYINKELPDTKLDLFTNASLLNSEALEALSKIKNINFINCSLNSYCADDYRERVGLNFEITVNNIKNLLKLNKEKNFANEITVATVEFGKEYKIKNKEYNDKFVNFVAEKLSGATIKTGYKYNYLNKIPSFRKFRNIKCPKLTTLCVLANGLVSLCCMDMDGEYILGNVNERPLLKIYNGELAKLYRSGKKSKFIPCKYCNML